MAKKQLIKVILFSLFIFSGWLFVNQFQFSNYFPIKTVNVYGIVHADRHEVQAIVLPLVNHGFFTVNVDYIRDRLLQMPWIANIYVRRNWPDQIEIKIVEKEAIARFHALTQSREESATSLLSKSGELFSPEMSTYPSQLPDFIGAQGEQEEILQYFYMINRILLPLHAKISYLELTPYFSWKVTLDNGIKLQMGHKNALQRLDQFVKIYPKMIGNRRADVDYIDLRYSNGIAVQWKD